MALLCSPHSVVIRFSRCHFISQVINISKRSYYKMSELDKVDEVDIDPSGVFKYILIEVKEKGKNSAEKKIVRGYARCDYHGIQFDSANAEPLRGFGVMHIEKGRYRNVAFIMRENKDLGLDLIPMGCSGILLTRKHVLTAESCLADIEVDITHTKVLAGSDDLTKCTEYNIVFWKTYSEYKEQISNGTEQSPLRFDTDLAIIELSEYVHEDITPAIVSLGPIESIEGSFVEIVGWGTAKNDEMIRYMHSVVVTILSAETCQRKINGKTNGLLYKIDLKNICTVANPPVSLSRGDSGGPVIQNNKVLAVNTRQVSVKGYETFNLHLHLKPYKSFIDFVTKNETVTYESVPP